MNVFLSPLNPINFYATTDEKSGELQRSYVQQFADTDTIVLQFVGDADLSANLLIGSFAQDFQKIQNGNTYIYHAEVRCSRLSKNVLYDVQIQVLSGDDSVYYNSDCFVEIADCENTKLIAYKHESSVNPFNTYFGNNAIFQIRIPVGFKSNSIRERLSSETFRNQNQKLQILYSYPYQSKTLIIGDGLGVPNWMAGLINRIFSLSHVYIDNTRYVRGDDSVPEQQGGIDGYPFHVYTMTIENYSEYDGVIVVFGDFSNDFNEDYFI